MTRILVLALLAWPAAAQSKWQPLFDGKTLRGWTQCNGQAKYEVVNGEIVGTTAEGSPNSFLCTDREYGDFVLELEAKTDPSLNSGIQIRSHRYGADASVMTFNGGQFVPANTRQAVSTDIRSRSRMRSRVRPAASTMRPAAVGSPISPAIPLRARPSRTTNGIAIALKPPVTACACG
ncbi:MAG: DUF1080 domain-containing protein [Bryobacterales bacterium]|nr:DUF1080 domain-containing protein [Bryobacterales bacterium]